MSLYIYIHTHTHNHTFLFFFLSVSIYLHLFLYIIQNHFTYVRTEHMVHSEEDGEEVVVIRSYDHCTDRARVERLERSCEIGHNDRIFLFTDTLGDPICRIRNSLLHNMLVAEVGNELVGSVQGTIKLVTVHDNLVKAGYVLGLRVAPPHRRRGIGLVLVRKLEEWFAAHGVDYAYMATQKDNDASLRLFVGKLGYDSFLSPAILVNPVNRRLRLPSGIAIRKLKVEEAELRYRRHVAETAEFFPDDIDRILRNKLSLGTWVAYYNKRDDYNVGNWAMLSVWNSGEVFKLRIGKAPLGCLVLTKGSNLIGKYLSCVGLTALPDLFTPFGFYFVYGVHTEGQFPMCGRLVRALSEHVNNMAARDSECKVIVTEIGGKGGDDLRRYIPHWKLLSCDDDLWCIKPMKLDVELASSTRSRSLFVDPREV
ncbi:PREDICTED: probable N-acetyltransferase HLS1 [Tarenaya hassleriana]|uniref:probable N-acetyltransferase HLS1 n=1 Tax=Tarenaya hassleriana TaxID=28532 RepID=UPI00053C2252|nr:PREDICTED: probable N-acetyltransferase HLS1 [Tarenaya hassleriana]